MKFALKNIAKDVYYFPDNTNIGVICNTKTQENFSVTDVYLVDGGFDEKLGEKILLALERLFVSEKSSFVLKAIICTHSHSDHIASCNYLKKITNCEIWITQKEKGNLEFPLYEQSFISGGFPLPEIQSKFYQGEPILTTKIIDKNENLRLDNGIKVNFVSLPGHHFDMIGVLVKTIDNKSVFFASDAIFDKQHMKKYWIPFTVDIGNFKVSLRKIVSLNADYVLPSHGHLLEKDEIESTSELNIYATISTEKSIISLLKNPMTKEDIIKAIADENEITFGVAQYYLTSCTIMSYLSYLYRAGKINYYFKDNKMLWQKI